MNKFSLKNNTKYNNPNLSFSSESNNAQKSILDTIQNVGEILNQIDNIEKNDGTNLIEELQRLSEMLGLRKTDEQTAKVCLNNLAYFYNIDGNFCEEEKESFHKQCEHWGTPQQIEEAIFLSEEGLLQNQKFSKDIDGLAFIFDVIVGATADGNVCENEIIYIKKELDYYKDKCVNPKSLESFMILILSSVLGLVMVMDKQKKIIEEQKDTIEEYTEELQTSNENLQTSNEQLADANQDILKSIQAGKIIQNALLDDEKFKTLFPDSFILYKPRDIVSGDFYRTFQHGNKKIVVAADCTGHGVPGAFMSMLGIAFFNEIASSNLELSANEVLDKLRFQVKKTLGQEDAYAAYQETKINRVGRPIAKNGMDLTLVIVDEINQTFEFSGAHNCAYLFKKNGEFQEFKGDRQPIGVYPEEKPFKNQTVVYDKDDTLYMLSDGYVDQNGGPNNRKFMSKNFKKLLSTIQDKPLPEQQIILNQNFEERMDNQEQVDDVLVMGIKL